METRPRPTLVRFSYHGDKFCQAITEALDWYFAFIMSKMHTKREIKIQVLRVNKDMKLETKIKCFTEANLIGQGMRDGL